MPRMPQPPSPPKTLSQAEVKEYISKKWKYQSELEEFEQASSSLQSGLGQRLAQRTLGVVAKPFEAIDPLRRMSVGLAEMGGETVAGLASGQGFNRLNVLAPDDDRGYWDKVGDPMYGFGSIVPDTGNKWADRAIGFTGDVMLDPTTYITAGTGRFAGQMGRAELVNKLRLMGHAENTGMLRGAGRLGISSLNDQVRKQLGDQAGVRFMGARIPGTRALAEKGGRAASTVRARIGDTGGAKLREIDEISDALRTLNGRAGAASAKEIGAAAERVFAYGYEGVGANTIGKTFSQDLDDISKMKRADRVALTHATEAGEETVGRSLAERLFDSVKDTVTGLNRRQNYVMHLPTREGVQAMRPMIEAGELVVDTADSTGRAFERTFRPNTTYNINGTPIYLEKATIKEINEKVGPALGLPPGAKVFEDDFALISTAMVRTTGTDYGRALGQRMIADTFGDISGNAVRAGDVQVPKLNAKGNPVRNMAETAAAREAAGQPQRIDELSGQIDSLSRTADYVRDPWRANERIPTVVAGKRGMAAREISNVKQSLQAKLREVAEQAQREADGLGGSRVPLRETLASDGNLSPQAARRLNEVRVQSMDARQLQQEAQERVARAMELHERLRGVQPNKVGGHKQAVEDLREVADFLGIEDTPAMRYTYAQLEDVERRVARLAEIGDEIDLTRLEKGSVAAEMKDNTVIRTQVDEAYNQSRLFAEGDPDAVAISEDLAKYYKNAVDATQEGWVWEVLDEYTKLFKAWATATPGFHVRNAVSALFMNAVAGVSAKSHVDAIAIMRQLQKDPEAYLTRLANSSDPYDQKVFAAVEGALGSGMGGRVGFDEIGRVGGRQIKGGDLLGNNWYLRLNMKFGEWVEGPARLAMALDTVFNEGGDAFSAMNRIGRFHFNYAQLSGADRKVKQFVPFWTFMSRSLPLQLQEMWMRPGKYAAFQSAVRNATDPDAEGDMPDWMRQAGGFMSGDNTAFTPDFPHLDVGEQLGYFGFDVDEGSWDPRNMTRVLANTNPLPRVLAELMLDKQFFQDRPFYDDESKLMYALENIIPGLNQAQRVSGGRALVPFGGELDERRNDKWAQAIANYFGVPYKQVD